MLYFSPDPQYIVHTLMSRFYSIEELNPDLKLLSENYDSIKEEFLTNKDKLVWTNWSPNNTYVAPGNDPYEGWQIAGLYLEYGQHIVDNIDTYRKLYQTEVYPDPERGIVYGDNAKSLPILTDIAYKCGLRTRVGVSVVYPGKHIGWHTDNDPATEDTVTLRGLWGLDINSTSDEYAFLSLNVRGDMPTEHFENNKFIMFWGRTTHMVYNTLKTPRYCLCFDMKVNIDDIL